MLTPTMKEALWVGAMAGALSMLGIDEFLTTLLYSVPGFVDLPGVVTRGLVVGGYVAFVDYAYSYLTPITKG